MWPENRGVPSTAPRRSAPPLPRAQGAARCIPEAAGKTLLPPGAAASARASSKDASGAARWKPMLPGRPLRAGRDCESPCSRLGSDSPSVLSKSSLSHSQESQSIQNSGIQGGSLAPPWSHIQARVLWSSGRRDRAGRGIRPACGPGEPRGLHPVPPGPRTPGQDSYGRRPGPVIADMCRGAGRWTERRPWRGHRWLPQGHRGPMWGLLQTPGGKKVPPVLTEGVRGKFKIVFHWVGSG